MSELPQPILAALDGPIAGTVRWAGAISRQLRRFDISVTGKTSGNANTDALTLADLTVQELLVSALRDVDPGFRAYRMEAEESTGDLHLFADNADLTISIDPIDGTKQFRDRTGDGYGVLLHLRNETDVVYSLAFLPEMGEHGTWVHAYGNTIKCGADDPTRPAGEVIASLPAVDPATRPHSKKIYLIGFQTRDPERAQAVTDAGLEGYAPDDMPGSIYPLMATGDFGGSLIHTPNVYDFPLSLHIARILGGDAVRVDSGRPGRLPRELAGRSCRHAPPAWYRGLCRQSRRSADTRGRRAGLEPDPLRRVDALVGPASRICVEASGVRCGTVQRPGHPG